MNKIMVSLGFNADVSQAKKQIESLQSSLNSVMNMSTNSIGNNFSQVLVQDLQAGQRAAAQLQVALRQAFNEKTGTLDLSRFNQSMQQSGMTLQKYKAQLTSLGPTGQQAFTKLAQSIATAEVPMLRISEGVRRLGTTFMNTFRYQLSASALSGVIQAFSTAFNYAQDLNESLNNIRIVTGYSTEQMSKFAKEANKTAKALSTTTTAYTDASLIFYQQGLSGDAVKERADVVVKLANVTGQSAEVVSDQMTAIWNNFDDGSKSMEYYADVITKLGAATASSTDEISDGLEKFAAVSETVGLSYEMATAALATVTAETRQSADVVGTAFKTIFSRMEGLKLGDTLDDGTTLNQYSQALATAGVNIKDQNGQLREMDDILFDLGDRWGTLGKDQQVALAQSVAGVRQYNQFIALMSNWDKVQTNLNMAKNSTGELGAQADIYADSWEAAKDRVTASLEDIYNKLIDDDFFIGLLDFGASFFDTIGNIIDSLGGLQGVLLLLGSVITRVFSAQIAGGITSLQTSIMNLIPAGRRKLSALQNSASEALGDAHAASSGKVLGGMQGQVDKREAEMSKLVQDSKNLTPEAQAVLKIYQQQATALAEAAHHQAEIAASQDQIAKRTKSSTNTETDNGIEQVDIGKGKVKINNLKESGDPNTLKGIAKDFQEMHPYSKAKSKTEYLDDKSGRIDSLILEKEQVLELKKHYEELLRIKQSQSSAMGEAEGTYILGRDQEDVFGDKEKRSQDQIKSSAQKTQSFIEGMGSEGLEKAFGKEGAKAITDYSKAMDKAAAKGKELKKVEAEITKAKKKGVYTGKEAEKLDQRRNQILEEQGTALDEAQEASTRFSEAQESSGQVAKESADKLSAMGYSSEKLSKEAKAAGVEMYKAGDAAAQHAIKVKGAKGAQDELRASALSLGQTMTSLANILMSVSMAFSAIKGIYDTWNNEDMSVGEKLLATFTSISMVLPMVVGLFQRENAELLKNIGLSVLKIGKAPAEVAASSAVAAAEGGRAAATAAANWQMLLGLAIILLVIGAIAGLIAIFSTLAASFTHAAKDKALQENIKALSEEADKTRESIENLKNAWSGWEDAYNTLQNLTKGTTEWNQALMEANQKALELLDTYPELAKYMTTDANGAITFNKKIDGKTGQDLINETIQEQSLRAQAASTLADAMERQRQVDNRQYEIDKEFDQTAGSGWADFVNAMGMAAAGAAIGSVIPVFGTIGGAIIGGIAGLVTGLDQWSKGNRVNDAIYEKLLENDKKNQDLREGQKAETIGTYEEFLNTFSSELAGTTESYKRSMYETAKKAEDQLEKNRQAIIQNNQLLIANNKAIASTILAQDDEYKRMSQNEQEATLNLASAQMAQLSQKLTNSFKNATDSDANTADNMTYEEFKTIMGMSDQELAGEGITRDNFSSNGLVGATFMNWGETATNQGELVFEKYRDLMVKSGRWQEGATVLDYYEVGDYGERAEIEYVDNEGNVHTEKISMNTMMTTVMSDTLAKQQKILAENAKDQIGQLTEAQLLAMQENGIASMTKEEFDKIFTRTGENEYGQTFRINIPHEDLETMAIANGYFDPETGQANIKDYKQHLLEMADAWDEVSAKELRYNKIVEQTNSLLEAAASETGYNIKTLKAYAKQIEKNAKYYNIKVNGELENNAELRKSATDLAISYARVQSGLKKVSESMGDNADVIKSWKKSAKDSDLPGLNVLESASTIADSVSEMFGMEVDADFIIDNIDLIEQALGGVAGAGESLANKVHDNYLEILASGTKAQQDLYKLVSEDFKLGKINDSEFIQTANEMIAEGKTTAEEVNAALGAIGYEAEIETAELTTKTKTPYPIYEQTATGFEPTGVKTIDTETTSTVQFLKPKTGTPLSKTELNEKGEEVTVYSTDLIGNQGEDTVNKKSEIDWDLETSDFASKEGKEKDKEELLKLDEEIDRYHEINKLLDQHARKYNAIERAKKKASGRELINLMNQEVEILKEENTLLEEKKKQIEENLFDDMQKVLDSGYGANIENGIITNYNEIVTNAANKLNAAKTAYNNSAQSDSDKEKLKKAEEEYEEFKEFLEQYEGTYEEWISTINELADQEIEIWEKQTEIFIEKIEQQIEAIEARTKALDYSFKLLEKALKKLEDEDWTQEERVEAIGIRLEERIESNPQFEENYRKAQEAWDEISDGYHVDGREVSKEEREQTLTWLESAVEDLTNNAEEIEELLDKLDEQILDALSDQAEEFDKAADSLDNYNNKLSHYNNLLDLLGKQIDPDGTLKAQIVDSQLQNAQAKIGTAKAEVDLLTSQLAKATSEEASEEVIDKIKEDLIAAQEELNSVLEEGLKAAAEKYSNTIDQSIKDAEKAMLANSKYDSWEKVKEVYDQRKELKDLYVEEYEKLYHINKLTRDINKSMSSMDSLVANQKLSKLLDEINKKKASGVKMSQYELDTLQRKYDLRLAEIALEEAQASKDSMRLMRDSQGNWSYVYTANQEKVADAQQKYEDALFELENTSREYMDEMQAAIIQNNMELNEAIRNLRVEDFASYEDYLTEIERLQQYYSEKNSYFYSQLGISIADINGAYGTQVTTFDKLVLAEETGIKTIEEGVSGFNTNVSTLLGQAAGAFSTYQGDMDVTCQAAGTSLSTLAENMKTDVDIINDKTQEISEDVSTLYEEAESTFDKTLTKIGDLKDKYVAEADKIVEANWAVAQSFQNMLNANADFWKKRNGEDENSQGADEQDNFIDLKGGNIPDHKGNIVPTDTPKGDKKGGNKNSAKGNIDPDEIDKDSNKTKTYDGPSKTVDEQEDEYFKDNFFTFLPGSNRWGSGSGNNFPVFQTDKFGNPIWNVDGTAAQTDKYVYMGDMAIPDGTQIIDRYPESYRFNGKLESIYQFSQPVPVGEGKDEFFIEWIPQNALESIIGTGLRKKIDETTFYYQNHGSASFDSGGYTGSWGPEGKMAMLHEKEIVLNKNDTQNLLEMVKLARESYNNALENSKLDTLAWNLEYLTKTIESSINLLTSNLSTILLEQNNRLKVKFDEEPTELQQNVSIEASFPGVTTAAQLEEAFNNIINDAAQYASSKK